MSSMNARPLSFAREVYVRALKKRKAERGEKTRQREAERKGGKRKSRKSETRGAAAGVEKLGARIMEYVGSRGGGKNGVRVAYD